MCPVCVRPVMVRVLAYGYSLGWTESRASLAVDAVLVFAVHTVVFFIVAVSVVAALVHADFASDTAVIISLYYVLG